MKLLQILCVYTGNTIRVRAHGLALLQAGVNDVGPDGSMPNQLGPRIRPKYVSQALIHRQKVSRLEANRTGPKPGPICRGL